MIPNPMIKDAATAPTADLGPTIFTALREVGLRVAHTKAPVEITVIDHAEKPSEN